VYRSELTCQSKISLCTEAIGPLVRFLRRKQAWDGAPHFVAL
jgi:hypothetical protein